MKNHKLILLLTIFSNQLTPMDNGGTATLSANNANNSVSSTEGAGGEESSQSNQSPINQVLDDNQDLLEMILCKAGSNPKMASVSRSWNQVFQERYKFLESLGIPRTRSLHLLWYKNLEDLYVKLARQAGKPITKPEMDINTQALLAIAQEAQMIQDQNLIKAWPNMRAAIINETQKMRQPITQEAPAITTVPAENARPNFIRDWLHKSETQVSIQRVTALDLKQLELTCLPEELSLFTSLEALFLDNNKLKEVTILETLTSLFWLTLEDNKLTEVTIPSTLSALEKLNLSNNQLTKIYIPATCTALKDLNLKNNQLNKITIPETLTALKELYLNDNQLEEITLPGTLISLQELWLDDNRLKEVAIPETLTSLEELYLGRGNQLLGSITIPDAIRPNITIC